MPATERAQDRKLLGIISILSLLIIALVAVLVSWGKMQEAGLTLLGTIVGGLLVNSKDVIGAIRESWSTRQVERMSDQLGASQPLPDPSAPQSVEVVNDPTKPVPVDTKPK